MSDTESKPVIFKKKRFKSIRQRKRSHEDDTDEETESLNVKLEEMKDLQKLRKRPNGVNIIGLAIGEKINATNDTDSKDLFKLKTGGMLDLSGLKSGKIKTDDAYDTGIGTQFSVETNKRDEDEEMMKYIEEQLSNRKGKETPTVDIKMEGNDSKSSKYLAPEEAALHAVPKHLRESSTQRSEEMLSNQMLSGIPEVDLGIEAKIKNIEATEEAKLKLLWEKHNKKDVPSQFVPTNMAVNFVQHNRYNPKRIQKHIDDRQEIPEFKSQDKPKGKDKGERATDDYHYEKFRKQFRKF